MAYPQFMVDWATRIYQAANGTAPRPSFDEISANVSHLFTKWPLVPFNPDTLIGRKSMMVYEQMRADDQVKGALSLKKGSVLSTGWEVEAASNSTKDRQVKEYIEYELTHLDPLYGTFDDHLYEIMSALDFGFSISEIVFLERDAGPFAGKVGLRTLKTRKPHLFRFRVDVHDNLFPDGILQGQSTHPIDKFLIFSYQREFGNWYGTSDLRAAYRPWWLKENTMRWWGIFNERFGIPISIGKYPVNTSAASIETLRAMLENIQANTAFTVPDTYSIELREASGRGAQVFVATVEAMDKAIARAILVPSLLGLSEQGSVGSYSQARKHFDVFMIIIQDLRRDLAEDVVNHQLIPRLVNINFQVDEFPRFRFLPFTTDDTTDLFNSWLAAVSAGVVSPVPEDEVHIRSVTEFPERSLDDVEKDRDAQRLIAERKVQEDEAKRVEEEARRREEERRGEEGLEDKTGLPQDPGAEPGAVSSQAQAHEYVRTRQPNKFERKVSFQRMEKGLDDIEADAQKRLAAVIEKQRESLIAVVAKKQEAGSLTTTFINSLDLKHKAEKNRVTRSFLQETYRFGRSEGRSTIEAKMQTRVTQGIPPEAALQFFEDKAFWMSGVNNEKIIADAQNVMYSALKTGEATRVTVDKLREVFDPYLGDDTSLDPLSKQLIKPHRLATMIRTNSTEAFAEGFKHSLDPEIASGVLIGFEYAAIIDGRQTEVCNFLDEKIFRPDTASLNFLTPSNHFNCRSLLIPVLADEGPVLFITEAEVGRAMGLVGNFK